MGERNIKSVRSLDFGSTNPKRSGFTLKPDGTYLLKEQPWGTNSKKTHIISRVGEVRAWMDGEIQESVKPYVDWLKGDGAHDLVAVGGLQNTSLSITDRDGKPVAIFFGSPPLHKQAIPEQVDKLGALGIEPTQVQKGYSLSKLITIAQFLPQILEAANFIGDPKSIHIEPFLTTLIRLAADSNLGEQFGFSPDEWRGIAQIDNDPQKTRDVMKALGFQENDQFTIQQSRMVVDKKTGQIYYTGGDFQTNSWAINELINEGRVELFNRNKDIYLELDSVLKMLYCGDEKERYAKYFPKGNGNGIYSTNANGASVNTNIMFDRLWKNEIALIPDAGYVYVDERASEALANLDNNPYFYFPQAHGLGLLVKNGREIKLETLYELPYKERLAITAAIYAGIGCWIDMSTPDGLSLVVDGGMLQEGQPAKPALIFGCVRPEVEVKRLVKPDTGALAAVRAMQESGVNQQVSEFCTSQHVERPINYVKYRKKWNIYNEALSDRM